MRAAPRQTFNRQGVTYPVFGALLAAGAPLGLLALRRFVLRDRLPISQELRRDPATYAYVTASTTLAFTLLGRILGRNAERLAELSTTDALTGLLNRRAFCPRLQGEIDRSRRSAAPVALLLIDLDELKALNDERGHAVGDRALQAIAGAIQREMRSIDIGGRLGGDEFGFVAVGTDGAAARAVGERLLMAIADGTAAESLTITASIGVVAFTPAPHSRVGVHEVMRAADAALYDAKRAGRNRVALGSLEPTGNA